MYNPPNVSQLLVSSSNLRKNIEGMEIDKENIILLIGENNNQPKFISLHESGNLLILGWFGSQKNKVIDAMLQSIIFLYSPEEIRLIIFDSFLDFNFYNGIPHLLTDVITDEMKLFSALKWTQAEIYSRLKDFGKVGARTIDGFNKIAKNSRKPRIILFINSLNILFNGYSIDLEDIFAQIIDTGNKVGIHVIFTAEYLPKKLSHSSFMSNVPSRLIFHITSQDESGVTKTQEAIYLKPEEFIFKKFQDKQEKMTVIQITDDEIKLSVNSLKKLFPEVNYSEEQNNTSDEDALLPEAMRIIKEYDYANASLLQRRLSIGYARAARLLDILESKKIVGPTNGSNPRRVLNKY